MPNAIAQNAARVLATIREAAERSGRSAQDVLLVGVTKTVDIPKIRQLLEAGVKNLGENRAQELLGKYPQLGPEPKWHFIGHLQTNKVNDVVDKAALIHSVDSEKLALEIDRQAAKIGVVMPVLIEVNMAGEESKFGLTPGQALSLARMMGEMPNLCPRGLMTVAPYVENPEDNRDIFKKMRQLYLDIQAKLGDTNYISLLSMGMTNDYAVAIEEGASVVRVGTGIFGAR